ncbi:protein kinase family protein, partial [Candidatus Roizmanbacteria bacterium]|nr:protein kinase family protein [Candidatus Roizmanbacteria bacterium]
MTALPKEDLIVADFLDELDGVDIQDKYLRVYPDIKDSYKKIFAYFHQSFNSLFDFMNMKNGINKHFNADSSRELIEIIGKFRELKYSLKQEGVDVIINPAYDKYMVTCEKFLVNSGGSKIPDDFEPFQIIKYDPILELPITSIKLPNTNTYEQLQLIGEGAFCIVQKYIDPTYNKTFAVKQLKKNHDARDLKRFKDEYTIMKKLNFPYVLEVYTFDDINNRYTMEYCDSTLHDYITKNNDNLPFVSRKKLAQQFLYGLNYIHKKNCLHRDLSYRNILLKQYDYRAGIIKLSDFGLVKYELSDFTKTDTEIKGTIIDPQLESFKEYNIKNEIYAVG